MLKKLLLIYKSKLKIRIELIIYFSFSLAVSCTSNKSIIKCDYTNTKLINSREKYFTVIQKNKKDKIRKFYYSNVDSTLLNIKRKYDYSKIEKYNDTVYYLNNITELRFNSKVNDRWYTRYDDLFIDSVEVVLLNILNNKKGEENTRSIYVFRIENNQDNDLSHYSHSLIYIDMTSKLIFREEYFENDELRLTNKLEEYKILK